MSLLLRNARIVGARQESVGTEPVDILLRRGVVTGIGAGLTGSAQVDLDGRWVIPGLWDDHVHLSQLALTAHRVDVSGATSAVHAARLMAAAPRPEHGLPLVGYGFRDALWPDGPSCTLLDEVVGDVPVIVLSGDLHCCWLNSLALAAFGLTGHSSGVLREDDAFPVTAAVRSVPVEVLDRWVEQVAGAAAGRGVVGVVDLEMTDNLTDWTRRFAGGFRGLRVEAGVYTSWLDAAIEEGRRTGQVLDGSSGQLSVGPFKVITDGSLNTRTAFCADPYPGTAGRGTLNVPPARLVELMRKASGAGLMPAVHAIGDEANRLALDAFETVGCRGRIEHAQLVQESDFARFAALGVAASVQPEHAMDDRGVADVFWAGRTGRAFALRALLDAGAELILGSDAPVAPLDPWVTIAAAVGRSRDGQAPWHPEQRITTAEALTASAHGASTVALGDVADLAIVDLDPLAATHEQLRSMPVAATLLAGYFTHNALPLGRADELDLVCR
ncbi:MAG: amidohydrolase [Microbacteriaceae bacterium]|nr:amidohydrolase [Microbacteriaceae bacterium]